MEESIGQERVTPLLEAISGGITLPAVPAGTLTVLAMAPPNGLGHQNGTTGAVAVGVTPVSGTQAGCADRSGWTITATDAMGNTPGQSYYIGVTGSPDPTLTATSAAGARLFVNVPPGRVAVTASKAGCSDISPLVGLTRGVQSRANAYSTAVVLVTNTPP
jgi:hypothetical protein